MIIPKKPINAFYNNGSKSTRERLIIFTRYPEPGRAKTRLIPALGPQGAAELQRKMTEHAVKQVREFMRERPVFVEIRYEGGNRSLVSRWLGRQFSCRRQGGGDIGARMAHAFRKAFRDGTERAVLIGTDCPGVKPDIMRHAFDALDQNDIVLGPANDGGYYLIGLHRLIPELFANIPWGTGEVIRRTVLIAEEQGLSVRLLELLDDVDNPEDLHIWEREKHRSKGDSRTERISIIIPTLNEASNLARTLKSIQNVPDTEVIVVDGGSTDGTVKIALSFSAKVLVSSPGRARQMNAGAAAATGDILLFLHADTRLPDGFAEYVRQPLALPGAAGGAFQLRIDAPGLPLRLIERGANWRSKTLQLPYGDQALFLRTRLFREMGGFPDIPIMEDLEFVRRLRERGAIVIAPAPAVTSARRWHTYGALRTTLKNQGALAAYYAGVALPTIAKWYNRNARALADSDSTKSSF